MRCKYVSLHLNKSSVEISSYPAVQSSEGTPTKSQQGFMLGLLLCQTNLVSTLPTLNESLLQVLTTTHEPESSVWARSAGGEGCREWWREKRGRKRGRARYPWEKKLSLVNQITLVTVCPGQTLQPNTLHLKHNVNLPSSQRQRHVC